MKNDLRVRCVQSLFLLAATILFMIALSVCGKIFFSLLLWLLGDGFNTTWQDVLHGAKLGLYGGSIGGIGLALFRIFKVKGF
ncbi:hypothetical protein AN2340V1_3825 [Klebsiella variicola]|uniref:hypothetical protein n=1 Tax=Klebsiella variicola TaxID=244366 RepID=UPI001D5A2867|nr:hypothetical protein [Klebsiella variicola]HCI4574996.1 hypothetical protein [Klebsiella variicola subsp. variicola]EKZ6051005.1 hypothetical protein [Klebsiella variicola]MDD1949560.1 hypothetical protein [Klebsiella variicola]CAF9735896.1 hypothetical protein AN2340V1_3825 [Klebsiella variicola]CAH6168797.1 hypothetical protein AN2340V1_3825 [Klebsiella variicola]